MGDKPSEPTTEPTSDGDASRIPDFRPQDRLPDGNLDIAYHQAMEFEGYPRQQYGMPGYPPQGSFDMSNMGAALSDYQMRSYQQHPQSFPQQFNTPGAPGQAMMYQYQQGPHFATQSPNTYNQSFTPQYPQYIQNNQPRHQHHTYPTYMNSPSRTQDLPNQSIMMHQSMHQVSNTSMSHQHLLPGHFPHPQNASQYAGAYVNRPMGTYPLPQLRVDSGLTQAQPHNSYNPQNMNAKRPSSTSSSQTSALRGPPRKPRQSGHALWVGNLPPSTNIIDLKDHFSKEATNDIESAFLISKSNCAFVNYKSEASCAEAMTRFHDSRFQGVRLVCRLRRGSQTRNTPSTGKPGGDSTEIQEDGDSVDGEASPLVDGVQDPLPEPEVVEKVKDKFFVVKSLTTEDLERSVQSGIWATQAHNEAALNSAYKAAENVYLIFSANKSGEYFGYARMESAIDDESAADIDYQPRPEAPSPSPSDLPLTILTPPTSTAPRGRIIDDSARGTIFWEALDQEVLEEDGENLSGENDESVNTSPGVPQTFGKPFKIKWMSTDRLPFYRTRGLRNSWNANREVKIARDGTEIEPSIGRRLTSMFHRPQVGNPVPTGARQHPQPQSGFGGYMPPHGSASGGGYGRPY